jgi:hypothetical protein
MQPSKVGEDKQGRMPERTPIGGGAQTARCEVHDVEGAAIAH